jgi:hypothetical protein
MPTTQGPGRVAPVTQQAPSPPWRPVNEVENRLVAALERDDRRAYFGILATAPLYLPQMVPDPAASTEADPDNYVTFVSGDVTYLLVFTSVDTLRECVGHVANGYVESDYDQLRAGLSDSEIRLGFNLGTPIDAWIDVESVARAAAGEIDVPTGPEMAELMAVTDPANSDAVEAAAEQELANYVDEYITGLIGGDVLVRADGGSWQITPVDGVPTIEVYHSAETVPPGTPTITVAFLSLVSGWPEGAEQLSVNPGTPLAFTLPADVLTAFAEQANLSPRKSGPPDG